MNNVDKSAKQLNNSCGMLPELMGFPQYHQEEEEEEEGRGEEEEEEEEEAEEKKKKKNVSAINVQMCHLGQNAPEEEEIMDLYIQAHEEIALGLQKGARSERQRTHMSYSGTTFFLSLFFSPKMFNSLKPC